ncbi:MAG: SixA phosphatase family protein [Actinomycetota bacterium]
MTRRLLVLRHAKSSWDEPSRPDHERPLTARGRRAADRVGEHLRSSGTLPDVVLCSSALRTRETLQRLALGAADVHVEDGLYGAGEDELLARLRDVAEDAGTVLLVGHNPGVHGLAVELAGPDLGEAASRLREKFPTAGLATFELQGTWRELGPGRVRLTSYVVRRELG